MRLGRPKYGCQRRRQTRRSFAQPTNEIVALHAMKTSGCHPAILRRHASGAIGFSRTAASWAHARGRHVLE